MFAAAQLTHTPMDFVYLTEQTRQGELGKYEVLFYPHAVILTKERMELLEKYVAEGGILVMGCRTGYKDSNGRCVMDHLPGLAARLTGTDIPEYSFVAPDEGTVEMEWDGERMEAAVFNDILAPVSDTARVLGTYCGSYYAGEPAFICNRFGSGKAYYFGGAFGLDTARIFLKKLGVANPYGNRITAPECCEIAVRTKGGDGFLFVLNYADREAAIQLKEGMEELLCGRREEGTVVMDKYGVKVYKIENAAKS